MIWFIFKKFILACDFFVNQTKALNFNQNLILIFIPLRFRKGLVWWRTRDSLSYESQYSDSLQNWGVSKISLLFYILMVEFSFISRNNLVPPIFLRLISNSDQNSELSHRVVLTSFVLLLSKFWNSWRNFSIETYSKFRFSS